MKRAFLLPLLLVGISLYAQKPKIKNYQIVDQKRLHFGFTIGLNEMDFSLKRPALSTINDTMFADVSRLEPGFQVSIVSELKINDDLALRFLPGLNFGQRNLNFIKPNGESENEMKIESNYLDFPLLLKYRAKRINNYRPYLVSGFSLRYDMAARKDYDPEGNEYILLKPFDYFWEFGFGVDFYLTYFKFSSELKFALGFRDVLVPEPALGFDEYVDAIDRLTSKIVMLSFHFE